MTIGNMIACVIIGGLCGAVGVITGHPYLGMTASFTFGALMGILEGLKAK